jgi:predicted DNA binding CopG/RHH family protein
MHAKMTRDRKKNFIATIEKTINDLEQNNQRMKKVLNEVVQTHFKPTAAPVTPKARTSNMAAQNDVPHLLQVQQHMQPAAKRICHGFAFS